MRNQAWPDRATAEQLLAGHHADTAVGRVLAHARGPAGPHELVGETAAAAGFRSAAAAPSTQRRRLLSRFLAFKLTAAAVLLTGSGLAVAGVTGTLPLPAGDDPRPAPTAPRDRLEPAPSAGPQGPVRVPPPAAGTSAPAQATPTPAAPTNRGKPKGPDERTHTPPPRGNTAHPTPGQRNDNAAENGSGRQP